MPNPESVSPSMLRLGLEERQLQLLQLLQLEPSNAIQLKGELPPRASQRMASPRSTHRGPVRRVPSTVYGEVSSRGAASTYHESSCCSVSPPLGIKARSEIAPSNLATASRVTHADVKTSGAITPVSAADDEVIQMFEQWMMAKRARNYATSDKIREALRAMGVEPESLANVNEEALSRTKGNKTPRGAARPVDFSARQTAGEHARQVATTQTHAQAHATLARQWAQVNLCVGCGVAGRGGMHGQIHSCNFFGGTRALCTTRISCRIPLSNATHL